MNKTKKILTAERIERAVMEKMKDIEVYDNKERFNWHDRYTVIIKGHIYTMSDNPNGLNGVCIYHGTICDRDHLNRTNTKISIKDLPQVVQCEIEELYNSDK